MDTIMELPDATLLERFAQQRDEAAFAELVERHGPMVRATCVRVLELPHRSEPVHVRLRVYVSWQGPLTRDSENVTWGAGSQLSVAVSVAGAGTALHSTVVEAGAGETTGGVVSWTVMSCVRELVLPETSRAVQTLLSV